jgi:predicted Zn-dependent peptidase
VPATTSKEHIEIDLDLPVENIELFFRLEADRMTNAVFRGWEAQRFTVLEQRLGRQGRRETRFDYEALEGVTAPAHPAYHPSGGHIWDFAHFNRQRMTRMYEDYFVPNNALLALVGDITEDRARTLAEQYFGRLPRAGPPPERLNVEAQPVPGGTVRLDWQEPLSPRVIVRHRIPAVGHADRPAFDAVAAVLRSNLAQSLSGAGLNASASVSASRSGSPSTITIDVSARHDADLAGIETTILNEVERLKHEPVAAHTLEGVQRALRFNWEQTRTDRGGLAAALGSFEVMDSWKTLQAFMEARERASPADIQRLASRYLVSSNRIVGTSRRNPEPPTSGARALTDGGAP